MAKIQNTNVSAATQVENKKVKKQQQKKEQQVFKGNGNKQTVKKPNDSALKQEIYKKTGFQLKDTANRGKIIPLKVNGKVREYETVGTLTTGGRILVKERGKEVYHVVSHTKDNKLVMLKDDYAKNKIFYESTSSEHKVKYGKKNYVITNSKRDRHGRMSAIDENGKRVVLSSDGKELKTGYVEAEDQKDNMNDYIAKQTKGKSKAEADKIRQQILSGNSSYSNKGVLRFKASNGEVWYYDTKRKTYVKYAEKEAQAIIKNLDKGATENWLLFRTGLGTDYELLKNTNAQIIDPEVLNKVNKYYSAEYGNKVDKNAQYGSGKYKTAYEAFLASEIGDDEVYQFNAALVKNNAITDQSRRNEILQTNLTKISGFGIEGIGVGVNKRANRMAAADAASTKEDYQALQDAAEEENKKKNYKPQFKGQDALQTYIYGVHDGDVQEIDDFNTTLIDPKEDMLDRDEIVRIKAETGVLWAKKGLYNKAFESQDSDVTKQMFALQSPNGKSALDAKLLKKQAAEKHQDDYLMMARPDLYSEDEIVENVVKMLQGALTSFKSAEDLSRVDIVRKDETNVLQLQATKTNDFKTAENLISRAYSLISNNSILSKVKAKMGDDFNVLMKKEDAHFKTNSFKNVTSITDKQVTEYSDKEGKVKLTPEQIAHNKYVVTWLKSQLADLERDKKLNEAKDGWKQDFVNWHRETYSGYATRSSIANKYQLIKSNMARLEAAAEGKLVDASGKPVSFEDAMKNLGETGIQALEHANADYQTAQQTGEFMVDMAVLALPLPKGFNAANTVIKMGNALYKVISKSDKACKVIKITQEAAKGSKIYEVVTNVATKNPKFVENARKVATIMDSSATGAMHMAGKTVVLDASNIATSREGFTSDRISEMNKKVESASLFGGMGGAIGGSTAVASEFVSSAGAKYTVHGVGLVADLMGAAGLMTAESHGETNFWDNLRCVNPDGSFNFEQASMTAMMIFGHLHGMSAVRGKVKPHVELQADGTFKAKLGDNVLTLNKDGIWSDSASGREFRLAENKNGKAELTELTKKEVAASHSEAPAEESRGTSTQQIKSFKERINNAKTREELNAIRDDIKKTDLTVQERNELMTESLKVQREWSQAPERRQIVNMATEGEASVMGKPELTALRQEVGIKQSKPGLHFEGETDGANTIINEMKGNDTVNSYIVSRDVEGNAHIEYKVSYENGKATDVEFYDADGTIKKLPAEKKQAVLDELNKPAETDPVSHSEAPTEESRVNSESHSERSEESQAKETPTTDKPVVAKEAQVKTETDKIEYVRDENGNVIKEIHKGDNLTREILKDAEGNVLESIENVYDSQGKLQKTIHKDAKGYTVAIYDNVNKRMVFDIREKSVNNNAQADSKPESHKHAESLPENWEIPENNMTTFRRNKNAVTDIKNINPEDISVDGNYTGYTHFSGPSEKSLGVNGDIRTFVLQQTDIGVAYDKAKNITIITTKINDAYNRPGIISIKVKGQVSEADGIALVKNLEKANAIPKTTSNIELSQELDVIGRRIQQETAKFFNEKQTNSARDIKAPVEESSVKPESHSERSEESQVAPKTEERKPVVENKGEGDKPVVEPQAKEPAEKPVTEEQNPVIASESEAIQPKQKTEGKTPVTSQEQSTGKTPEEAAAIYNEEMKTAGVTPVQQTKAQQLELERLQTLVQSKEGQVILADAMKDPNFGKPLSERVPDEGFKKTEDDRLQIEVDGVVYTQRNKGDAFLVSSDGKILEDCFGEEPKNPSATDNPNLTRLYRNGDKIFGIENQYGAIDYSHTFPEYYPAGKPNTSLNLSLGRPTENYIMTDNVGRVIYNYNPQLDAFGEYHSTTIQGRGRTMSDSNIVSDLNQAIQDVNLKNTTFSTKKGRQKAYEDVRTQIENAYKDNKLTGQDYENLVANLNAKAEKAGGLIVKETRYQQYVAKRAEVYETNRDLLSDKIDKVATKSDYDNMVAEINESFKSGKIDKESARVLNETLDAKGELIEGVETLSQKKAKIEKQVREIETAQRIEEVEANSQHRAELLDEYLAEFGENLPSEIGTKEYYDEALSTIDRGVKSGLIEPQKAEVLRTQAKEQLARLESESSQPAAENPVIVEESRGAESSQSANVEPKAGKKFKLSTDDIPTKLSDMQEFVEKNSLNALSFKVDDNTILYSIKNDETGGVMHVQFTDGKRSNMTIVKANDLQTYIEFAEDGVTPSKVRTDFIDNGKIFTRVEDKTTGQVAFEEPVVMNGKRSPAGLAIENDSPIAKRFNEGSIDLEGKFTPKEVNEGSGVKESLSERSEGAQAKDTPETENSVVGENETPKFEEVETNEGLQLRHKVGDENSYEFFNPETLKWEPTTKQFVDERVARDGVKAKPVEKTATENPVVGENETPKFEEVETKEGLQLRHKVGDENSYEFFNPETLKWETTTKQFFDERVARDGVKAKPVEKTIGESAIGNTPEEAAQIHNEEMNNVEPTSTTQVKNLEKYDIMFQSEEGKALLDNAKKDPNFGKTAEERVPSDKIVKDADGNIQSIEIDGVTYTRNEQGEYVNEKGDSQIQIETPDQNRFIIDPKVDKRITIDKENNKILRINSDDMTIEYDSNGQPEKVSDFQGKSIDLSTGDYSQDNGDINVDPTGRVIKNDAFIDINGRKYYPNEQEGYRYSDWGENAKGEFIDSTLQIETKTNLSKQIEDAQLENRGLRTTKKGRQKAYDDVRNQIEDAYNNSKIDRETADNLHAKLNEKAKANGLETQETPTMVAEREALAKWNEQADTIKGDLMSVIEKSVDSQVAHDRMVEIIGEHCKNGKIDMNRANELYDALETKANSIDGVESLAKKAERINAELKAHEIKFAEESQGQKEPLTKESLEKDIEALKQGDDVSEYLGKLDEAKKQGILTEDEVVELTQKATEKVNEVVIPEIKIEYATEEDFPETPTKPKQLEKKTLEDILGDEQAPKTADEAKKYAEEHEDAEFVASDDPNICDMLFLDKDHDNIIYYNKDGVKAYREYNPSEAIERRDTSLYSDGTVESVETRTVDGNLKVEAYDPDGNLKRKELYDTDNGVWTAHQVYFDSEGNMIVARKVVLNKETKSWEPTAEYEYNAERNAFEQKNEKDEVVSTVKYDEATEHWAEFDAEGKAIHEIKKPESVVEPAPVEEHQGVTEIESSTGEPTPVGENSENNPASEKVEKRNSDGTKIPKKFRGRDDVTYDPMTKTYTERTEMYGVTTESIYDSKGRLLQEVEGNKTKYYNPKGEVIAEQEITDHGIKRTEKSKDYDLDVLLNSLGEGEKITIKYHEDKKGNTAEPEEFIYNKDKNVYENMGPEGTVFKTVEYDAKNHKWTIKDSEGKKIDSQNNMKESHIKRNIGIGAGVLALGGVAYGISKFVKSDDDKEVEQPAKPTAKPAPKKDTPAPKAETKVTLDGKEGTIAEDGTLTLDGKKYPKDTDGTYTIGDKKYKVEDGKLVEVVDTPNDNGETGGTAPETTDVTGTIGDKEYIIKDGKVSVDGEELTPDENGHYKIGDDKYKIEDGKLVKVEPEEPAKTDTDTDAAQSDDSQTGGGRTDGSSSGTTGSQGGRRTGGSTSGTTGSQGGRRTGGSASGTTGSQGGGRTGGSTSGNTGATHNDTSRPVTTPHSEQSEESRHTGNTPVTDVTEPTEEQKQVAKTLQDEISSVSTEVHARAFVEKLESAVKTGQITPRQGDELMNLLQIHAETLNEAIKIQNEQDAIQKPEFGLGEVTTPQEPQRKEKREITPVERMELTKKIRNAKKREDIAEIQQEMRQYKVFPGRKNLRRAYKAKLRAIKHQDEPQKVEKYNEKFEKRMEKIENSKVYKNDKDQINRENFQEMKYLDDIIKRPKNFDDGTLNA